MQPFTSMAVDAALENPAAWTRLEDITVPVPAEPRPSTSSPERWIELPDRPFIVSTRGRVRSKVTRGLLKRTTGAGGRHGGWRVRIDGKQVWLPWSVVQEYVQWER